jgi:Xaa-Pro dipeptidase
MGDRIRRSVQQAADVVAVADDAMGLAGGPLHHLSLGPGPALTAEWVAAGLTLPDLARMRRYRLDRVIAQLHALDYAGVLVMDPMNIRYATDATNMQVWVMHNASRYAWVGADGRVIVWEFSACEFLDGHNDLIDEVRPAISATYFQAGQRYAEQARRWADELLDVAGHRVGAPARIAIDQCPLVAHAMLLDAGVVVGNGQEVMERARNIKSADEIAAMRCAVHACEQTMGDLRDTLRPGMTEREVWSLLHAGNIARAGEWIETQILSSGPRTNPWMQEASSRVIQDGDLVAYDTDLVGAYGMMVDISRTLRCGGGRPTGAQRTVHGLAREQVQRNIELLTPGRTFREVTHESWYPSVDTYRHYSVLNHGVGQCDEYPEIYFPHDWDEWGVNGVVQPSMVFTVEAYVGRRDGGEGVKLENQVLVTADGPELLTHFPLDLT